MLVSEETMGETLAGPENEQGRIEMKDVLE